MDIVKDGFLTYGDLAGIFRVTERHLRREIRAGRLKHVRLGRSVRFTREQVEEYINLKSGNAAIIPPSRRRRAA